MRGLALLPLVQLNAALISIGGSPRLSKQEALVEVQSAVHSGLITLDGVAKAPIVAGATKPQAATQNLDNIKAQLDLEHLRIIGDLRSVRKLVNSALNEVSDLKRKAQAPLDPRKIEASIRASVEDLFDQFKKEPDQFSPPEVIAQAFPKLRREEAQNVFDGDLCYVDDEGNMVDFSTFEVELWDDPAAPMVVSDYIFDPAALHQTLIALSHRLPHNTWLGGERGTGKTEFVTQIAARLKRRLFRINFDEGLERSEFIGSNTIENGNVVWKAGLLTQAIRHAGSIVLLDEVGFARAQNISPLHAVTERTVHRALVIAETGERIPVSTGVVFFAADNSTGHGDESGNFAGVREQNSAFLDRFSYTLRFEYLKESKEIELIHKRTGLPEKAAQLLVQFANTARAKARSGLLTQPPSLRQLFAWASAVQSGMPVGIAFTNAIVNKFPSECESELRGIYSAVVDSSRLKSYLQVQQ